MKIDVKSLDNVTPDNQLLFLQLQRTHGFVPKLHATLAHSETALRSFVTGQTGKLMVEQFDRNPGAAHLRLGVRSAAELERLRAEGRDLVHFDLDDPRTFGAALSGVDSLYLLTGYTIAMITQSKTLVDAAVKAGVSHIVNQGVFAE